MCLVCRVRLVVAALLASTAPRGASAARVRASYVHVSHPLVQLLHAGSFATSVAGSYDSSYDYEAQYYSGGEAEGGSWAFGGSGMNCDQTCLAAGATCHEEDLLFRNGDVDSRDELRDLCAPLPIEKRNASIATAKAIVPRPTPAADA